MDDDSATATAETGSNGQTRAADAGEYEIADAARPEEAPVRTDGQTLALRLGGLRPDADGRRRGTIRGGGLRHPLTVAITPDERVTVTDAAGRASEHRDLETLAAALERHAPAARRAPERS